MGAGGTHHVAHLVRDALEPVVHALGARDHARQFAPDDRERVEGPAERLALAHPPVARFVSIRLLMGLLSRSDSQDALHALFDDEPLGTSGRAAEHPALVVKVAEHDEDAATFLPEGVLDRHLDLVERHVRGTGGGRIRGLDLPRLDTFAALDEDHGESVVCLTAHREAWKKQIELRVC